MYPNASCPIMGKPVSTRLYADTDLGRMYVCCKSCIADILDDVKTAYLSSFPAVNKLENRVCPVTGLAIDKDSPRVTLQGFEFSVHDEAAARLARIDTQVTLALLNEPVLVDLKNPLCPVTGSAVTPNAFAIVESTVIRLSSPACVEAVSADPLAVLAAARAIRAKEQQGATQGAQPAAEGSDRR